MLLLLNCSTSRIIIHAYAWHMRLCACRCTVQATCEGLSRIDGPNPVNGLVLKIVARHIVAALRYTLLIVIYSQVAFWAETCFDIELYVYCGFALTVFCLFVWFRPLFYFQLTAARGNACSRTSVFPTSSAEHGTALEKLDYTAYSYTSAQRGRT